MRGFCGGRTVSYDFILRFQITLKESRHDCFLSGNFIVSQAKKDRAAIFQVSTRSREVSNCQWNFRSHGVYMCPGAELLPPDTIRDCLICMSQDISYIMRDGRKIFL